MPESTIASADDAVFDPKRFGVLLNTVWLCILMVLLPVKQGMTLSGVFEQGNYPLSQVEWILAFWPTWLAPLFVGATLAVTLLYSPPPGWATWRRSLHLWLPWALLPIVMIPGMMVTTEVDESRLQWLHFLSVPGVVVAVILHLRAWPAARYAILVSAVLGGVIVAVLGWQQRLWGLEEMRQQIMYMQTYMQQGQEMSVQFETRLMSERIYATFASSNNLAAHLALLLPLVAAGPLLLVRSQLADAEPADRSRRLALGGILAVLLLGIVAIALLWTGSRGGQLATVVAAGVAGIVAFLTYYRAQGSPRALLRRGLVIGIVGAVVLGGFAVVGLRTRVGSLEETVKYRIEYWQAGAAMFREAPLTGVGTGEYQNWHLRLKPAWLTEEARLPHNVVVFFGSQAGVAGILGALYLLAMPVLLMVQFQRGRLPMADSIWLVIPVLTGLTAWLLHALVDFNIVIPGTVLTAAVLPLCLVDFAGLTGGAAGSRTAPATTWGLRGVFALLAILLMAAAWQRMPGEKRYQQLANQMARPQPAGAHVAAAKAVAADLPHNPNVWFILARKALAQQQPSLAVDAIDKAIALTPHRAKYYALKANAHLALGERDAARDAIDQAIIWYPNRPAYQELHDTLHGVVATPTAPTAPEAEPEETP